MDVSWRSDGEPGGALTASPEGPLDAVSSPRFWVSATERLGERPIRVLLDLSAVPWMASAGVGVLVRLLNHLRARGGDLAVYGCNERVREVLRISMLEEALNVSDGAAEARARLRPGGSDAERPDGAD